MENEGLDKQQYLEAQNLIKSEFVQMKAYLKDTFVCKEHCGQHRGRTDKEINILRIETKTRSEAKNLMVQISIEALRIGALIVSFLGANKFYIYIASKIN